MSARLRCPQGIVASVRRCHVRVVGFHLNCGMLAAVRRVPEPSVAQVVARARTVAVLEDVSRPENPGSIFRSTAGLRVDVAVFGPSCIDPLH